MTKPVIVIGAGIAGLATAYRLAERRVPAAVFEATDVVGGRMATLRSNGFSVDSGADGLLDGYRATWSLLTELGLRTEVVSLRTPTAGVWRAGRIHVAPSSLFGAPMFTGLSTSTKLGSVRLAPAVLRPARFDQVTVADMVREVGGRAAEELLNYGVEPAIRGLFGWDVEQSSAGMVLRILGAARGRIRLRTYRDGMDTLARELARRTDVRLGAAVREVRPDGAGVAVVTQDGVMHPAPACVLAVPAPIAVRLTAGCDVHPFVAAATYTKVACVDAYLDRPMPPPGVYGVTFPSVDEPVLGWAAFESAKPGRTPVNAQVVRLAATGAFGASFADDPELAHDTLLARAAEYFPGLLESVVRTRPHYFPHGLPEARADAQPLFTSFQSRPHGPVEFAGDWTSIPCSEGAVRSAVSAADRVAEWVGRSSS
ncbi:protoporphyrinogen/coproporphyrinogen oxidase [Nocardia sp. NPDC058658]|uniref:protoporphyrinogen/coproporphyrinogen oxidase n=1 Tax=Nocardia sp. NPDC058658 TaxID=3346580 RepID=UPI00364E81BB